MTRYLFQYPNLRSLTLIIIIILQTNAFPESGLSKGSSCRFDEQCDRTSFLQCVNKRCDCSGGLKWVPEEDSCMIVEGESCGTQNPGDCVPNSFCSSHGVCECHMDYQRDEVGFCELSYGSPCSKERPCASRLLLECTNDAVCKCMDEGIAYEWDEEKEKCVSRVGFRCDLSSGDAYYGIGDYQLECSENSHCVDDGGRGFCECKPGYGQTSDGACRPKFGEKCESDLTRPKQNCNKNDFLLCRDGKCDCEFYGQMKYEEDTRKCRALVNEACQVTVSESTPRSGFMDRFRLPECVKDAYCKAHKDSRKGKCVCLPGFVESKGMCTRFRGHGLPCSASVDCDRSQFLECAFDEEGIGHCKCFGSMYFEGKECKVKPGNSCVGGLPCTLNSYCEGQWCVCNQGYEIGMDSVCVKIKEDEKASTTEANVVTTTTQLPLLLSPTCDGFFEETVDWKKCKCDLTPTHQWMVNEAACLALVGAQCIVDSDCIHHAQCDKNENICQCISSALTTSDLTCMQTFTKKNVTNEDRHHHDNVESFQTGEVATLRSIRIVEESSANAGTVICQQFSTVLRTFTTAILVIMSQYCSL